MSESEKSALAGREGRQAGGDPQRFRRDTHHGILVAIGAYLIWGLVPLFFKQLAGVPASEIIAHRVLWSLVLMSVLLAFMGGYKAAWKVVSQPLLLLRVAIASALVMGNWLTFVYGVNAGRILETSFGYFILPLVSVGLGLLVLGEKLRPSQWIAVGLAAIGVALEAWRMGGLPWISLVLAGSFGIYGLLRKQLPLDAATGLFLETACMTPFALAYLLWLSPQGSFGLTLPTDILLIASGPITAIPLLMFAIGARRLPLNVMGFLQYLAPTITFLLAVFVYDEPMNATRLGSFALIWAGLAIFTTDLLRRQAQAAKLEAA